MNIKVLNEISERSILLESPFLHAFILHGIYMYIYGSAICALLRAEPRAAYSSFPGSFRATGGTGSTYD